MRILPSSRILRTTRFLAVVLLPCILITVGVVIVHSAYLLERPISSGKILQTYLWTAEATHRGLDFSYPTGTNVYATENGKVVNIEESVEDGEGESWGNFVLIQHTDKHYDAALDSNSYVYTIYAHLKEDSVIPSVGAIVSEGTLIAQSGDTGNSSGPHLHLQVVLHPQPDRVLRPVSTLDSENKSRNPEVWLEPLSGTGRAFGKVNDNNGNSIPNLVVCGIVKNPSVAGNGYTSSQTYSFGWANPDDVFRENFGTTDIKPGTYALYANPLADGCSAPYYYSLGTHTFSSNRATYVGLYPSWSPVVRPAASGWNTDFFIRNHAANRVSKSYSTFGDADSLTNGQRFRTIPANGMAVVDDESATSDMMISVPSEDASVVVMVSKNTGDQPAGYTSAIAANDTGTNSWEIAGPTVYVPLVKKNWYSRFSKIYVTNTGILPTTITVTYYNEAGNSFSGGSVSLTPNGREEFFPGSGLANGVYSAKITSNNSQPLAAIVLEGKGLSQMDWPAAYNGFSSGATTLYAPLIKKNYLGQTTGITIQNVDSSGAANVTVEYFDMSGIQVGTAVYGTVPNSAPYVVYNPSQIPDSFVGSVRVTSTNGKKLVGQMSEADTGSLHLMSNLTFGGTTTIHIPIWYENYTTGGNWTSGVNVRNTGSGSNNITATLYNQAGNVIYTQTATLTNANDTHNFYDLPPGNFIGSMKIQSTSNKPIVAVSNIRNWSGVAGKDSVMAINGSNR